MVSRLLAHKMVVVVIGMNLMKWKHLFVSAWAIFNIAYNVWCYEQVCLAEMFNFSTNIIGKLAYSTCYMQCGIIVEMLI